MMNGPVSPASYTNLTEQIAAPALAGELAIYLTAALVIPANTLSIQQWITFVLMRLGGNASDTNTGNFQLINVTMEQ
jgi:hypothetical protein